MPPAPPAALMVLPLTARGASLQILLSRCPGVFLSQQDFLCLNWSLTAVYNESTSCSCVSSVAVVCAQYLQCVSSVAAYLLCVCSVAVVCTLQSCAAVVCALSSCGVCTQYLWAQADGGLVMGDTMLYTPVN
ncbi:hypothetical protein MG293_008009 [Ovis ammon polii]|uniref:Uncharacterized protein n=1 Tax=Ovis ammon polii TaxID=230172 RepID=A0AAD4YB60_OVIAM|nr:hypothetical protein MG293_008009 [Ovis ammon polii]